MERLAQVRHPVFARLYPTTSRLMERRGLAARRQAQLAGLRGQVLEVGAGNGTGFAHYPVTVNRVLALEPEPFLRARAAEAARSAPVPVEVVDGVADRLPVATGGVDAVVASLVLCSVPDQSSALAEMFRVLRPGGELRFLEHGQADSPGLVRLQRVLDATIWPSLAGGCRMARDTPTAIEAAGFTMSRLERFRFPSSVGPMSFWSVGTATR